MNVNVFGVLRALFIENKVSSIVFLFQKWTLNRYRFYVALQRGNVTWQSESVKQTLYRPAVFRCNTFVCIDIALSGRFQRASRGLVSSRGEAGIAAWLEACTSRFREWRVFASPQLGLNEASTQEAITQLRGNGTFNEAPSLHLTASVRSFRSSLVSEFVNALLTFDRRAAQLHEQVTKHFPIVLTRDVTAAKQWVRDKARGSERFGILASSAAQRLRPYAIDVTSKIDPVKWFLNDKRDVRSSYFLESVATEFDVQGLELDWTCLAWDADFRCRPINRGWDQWAFRGSRWERISQAERKAYHVNAYRVLLTRARQGMVIVVPHGADIDHTRQPEFYDQTYE
ncbi:MAG: DUF2075 domain-containing protein [Candidatus Kapabacteria bacterium]|nr:DUF2075 domain-containing protein [Candidatus Kapabacteria bacterium]